MLSRLICEIAHDPYLGDELVFRGGTCFHKLFLPIARRYSEDLDYVRTTNTGIRELTKALTGDQDPGAVSAQEEPRAVFDMWLALTEVGITGDDLLTVFPPYRPDGLTSKLASRI